MFMEPLTRTVQPYLGCEWRFRNPRLEVSTPFHPSLKVKASNRYSPTSTDTGRPEKILGSIYHCIAEFQLYEVGWFSRGISVIVLHFHFKIFP